MMSFSRSTINTPFEVFTWNHEIGRCPCLARLEAVKNLIGKIETQNDAGFWKSAQASKTGVTLCRCMAWARQTYPFMKPFLIVYETQSGSHTVKKFVGDSTRRTAAQN